jgi:hypothetical protein
MPRYADYQANWRRAVSPGARIRPVLRMGCASKDAPDAAERGTAMSAEPDEEPA